MATDATLEAFTSIITLLTFKHPDSKQELSTLKTAVTEWHMGQTAKQLSLNRKLSYSKVAADARLSQLFNNLQYYFINLFANYDDPNLRYYHQQFLKIKQLYEFMNVDFVKLITKCNICVQTEGMYSGTGVDFSQFVKNAERQQQQIAMLTNRIQELLAQKQRLYLQLQNRQQIEEDYKLKIQQIKRMLTAVKTSQKSQPQIPHTYRSEPQILKNSEAQKNQLRSKLLDTFNQMQNLDNYSKQGNMKDSDRQDEWRMIYSQALSLESMLMRVQV